MAQHLYEADLTGRVPLDECVQRPASNSSRMRRNPIVGAIRRALWPVVRAHRRNVAIMELSALSDRQLRDIGVERHRIPEVVDRAQRAEENST